MTTTTKPICPICSTDQIKILLLRQSHKGYRCPRCHVAFLSPVPAREDLPAIRRCPECARHDRIQMLVRLDYGEQWCPVCNHSEIVLTAAQQARLEAATRLAVSGCYGDACKRPKVKSGRASSRKRSRSGRGNRGFSVTTPLYLVKTPPARRDLPLERASTRRKKS